MGSATDLLLMFAGDAVTVPPLPAFWLAFNGQPIYFNGQPIIFTQS